MPGFGELIPGIDGGSRYGYREIHPRWALAEWDEEGPPHIPGRGGWVRNQYYAPGRSTAPRVGFAGYNKAAEHRNVPEPREISARAEADMKRQLAFDGEDRAQQWAAGLMSPEQLQRRYQHL